MLWGPAPWGRGHLSPHPVPGPAVAACVEGQRRSCLASPWRGWPAVEAHLDGPGLRSVPSPGSDLGLPSCCSCVRAHPVLVLSSYCPQEVVEGSTPAAAAQGPGPWGSEAGLSSPAASTPSAAPFPPRASSPGEPPPVCSRWHFLPSAPHPRRQVLTPVSHVSRGRGEGGTGWHSPTRRGPGKAETKFLCLINPPGALGFVLRTKAFQNPPVSPLTLDGYVSVFLLGGQGTGQV